MRGEGVPAVDIMLHLALLGAAIDDLTGHWHGLVLLNQKDTVTCHPLRQRMLMLKIRVV